MRLRGITGIILTGLISTVFTLYSASADEFKSHGEFLHTSGKYKVMLLEMDGWISIQLVKKERGPGGPVVIHAQRQSTIEKIRDEVAKRDPRLAEDGPVIREENEIELALIRAEVIQTAEPNYLSNPGARYRIIVVGGAVAPMYFNRFETGAANVRDEIWNEAFKLYSQAGQYTIEQEAVYWGMMLAIEALHSSWRLPANLPLTLLRSDVGMFRIGAEDYGRRAVGRSQRFSQVGEGQDFFNVMQEDDELSNVKANLGPKYRRGIVGDAGGQSAPMQRRNNARDGYRENVNRVDFQRRQMSGPRDHQFEDRLAERGRPITGMNRRMEGMNAATRRDETNLEILRSRRSGRTEHDPRFEQRVGR